jgi:hypothetical protein
MAVDPAGFARVSYRHHTVDASWGGGHAILVTGVPTQTDLDQLAADIATSWIGTIVPHLSSAVVFAGCDVHYSDGTDELLGTSTASTAGGGGSNVATLSLAMVLSIKIGVSYRGGHPRMYLGGMPRDALATDQHWSPTDVGTVETDWAAHLAAVNALTETNITSVAPGAIHRYNAGVLLTPPVFRPYVGTKVQQRVCSQRRRLGDLL